MIKKFSNYNEDLNNEDLTRSQKIDAIIEFTTKDENSIEADRDDLSNLNDEMLDKFYNNLFGEQTNEGVTVSSPGSGTAVGGGPQGSFVSAMGVSRSGGDSGSAFSTNSSVSGMGAIVSPQPSQTPGDVRGSTKGSGDIGSRGGTYTKQSAGKKKKKKNSRSKIASDIDKLYTTNYKESSNNGKIIQNWNTFNEEIDNNAVLLRKLTEKSKLNFGKYSDLTIHEILNLQKTRYLRWVYYNIPGISFVDDILKQIGVLGEDFDNRIDKPGINPELDQQINTEKESRYSKSVKNVFDKRSRGTLGTNKFSDTIAYSKGNMQRRNQGR